MFYTFNIITFFLVVFVLLFGFDELMKIVTYFDLRLKLLWIELRTYRLRRRLKKEFETLKNQMDEDFKSQK